MRLRISVLLPYRPFLQLIRWRYISSLSSSGRRECLTVSTMDMIKPIMLGIIYSTVCLVLMAVSITLSILFKVGSIFLT